MLWYLWIITVGLLSASLVVIVILALRRVVLDVSRTKRRRRRKVLVQHLLPMLSSSGTEDMLPELLKDPSLLAEVGCELLELVRGAERERYAEVLSRIGVKDALLKRLEHGRHDRRINAAEALAAFSGVDAVTTMRRLLKDRDPEVRLAGAVASIAQDGDTDLKQLLRDLGSGSSNSRRLVQLFETAAHQRPETVLEIASDLEADLWHRMAAIEALGNRRVLNAAQPLLQIAKNTPELRSTSIQALGTIGHPIAKNLIEDGLSSDDWEVRAAAAEAAGKIGLTHMVGRLCDLLDDESWWVRLRAGKSLTAIGAEGMHALTAMAGNTATRAGRTAALLLAESALDAA